MESIRLNCITKSNNSAQLLPKKLQQPENIHVNAYKLIITIANKLMMHKRINNFITNMTLSPNIEIHN